MTTVMGSRIHQLRNYQPAHFFLGRGATHNRAGSRWIVCTMGCAIIVGSEGMADQRREGGEVWCCVGEAWTMMEAPDF